jgi:hypothetical protein
MLLTKKIKEELYANAPIIIYNKDLHYCLFFLKPAIYEDQKTGGLKIVLFPDTVKIGNLLNQKWLETHRNKVRTKDGDYLLRDSGIAIDIINPISSKTTQKSPSSSKWYDSPRGKKSIFQKITEFYIPPFQKKQMNTSSLELIELSTALTQQKTSWFQKLINTIVAIAHKVISFFKKMWLAMFQPSKLKDPKVLPENPQKINSENLIDKDNDNSQFKVIICNEEEVTPDGDDILNFFN